MHICVASSFPETANRNLSIVDDLAEGFRTAVTDVVVNVSSYLGLAVYVAQFKPTLVVLVGSALSARCNYRELAQACRAAHTIFAFWTVEDPYEFDVNYKFTQFADVVFSNDAWACNFYAHDRVYHLPTAASERLVRGLDNYAQRSLEVFFCGVGFANRRTLIMDALSILEPRQALIVGDEWPVDLSAIMSNRRLSKDTLIEHYAQSLCVLNIGRSFSYANNRRSLEAVTPGPRTFEAAMVGCVQLYFQPTRFLKDYFDPGTEIIVFENVKELNDKLDQLLSDPAAACAIAKAAQRRVLTDHTYTVRAQTILTHVGLATSDKR